VLGLHIRDRLARVAERVIDPMRGGVNRGRLSRTCHHQRSAGILLQVARESREPLSPRIVIQYVEPCGQQAERPSEIRCEFLDLAAAQAEPVVGHRAGHGELALDNIEPVHRVLLGSDVAAGRELLGVSERGRIQRQEVRVQGENRVGVVKVVYGSNDPAESQLGAGEDLVFRDGLVLDPLRLRPFRHRLLLHGCERGRRDLLAQKPDPGSVTRLREVRTGGLTAIDVTQKGIDKAYGVRQIEKVLKIPIKDMVFIGDALYPGGNDAAAKKTGVQTIAVKGPADTIAIIKKILSAR